MKLPPQDQIDVAVMWLESNEGEAGESDACKAVAKWLTDQAYESMLRSEARKAGVTVARLRRKLKTDRCGT